MSDPAVLPAGLDQLHQQIMNLPCDSQDTGYQYGHRDARHAAAELVSAAQAAARPAGEHPYACKVCGNWPDDDGILEHGKGCYTQNEDGGGSEYIEDCDKSKQLPPEAARTEREAVGREPTGAGLELPDSWGHWIDAHQNHWWIFGKPGRFMAQCLDPETGMPDDELPSHRLQELTGCARGGWRKERAADCSTAQGVSALDGILTRLTGLRKELTAEAQRIDAKMDAEDYDGDLDMDELEANTIRLCVQKLTAALEPKPTPAGSEATEPGHDKCPPCHVLPGERYIPPSAREAARTEREPARAGLERLCCYAREAAGLPVKPQSDVDWVTQTQNAVCALKMQWEAATQQAAQERERAERAEAERDRLFRIAVCSTVMLPALMDEVASLGNTTAEACRAISAMNQRYDKAAMNAKLTAAEAARAEAERESERLKLRLLSAAGDDLCRLTQEEIKDLSAGKVQIPPKEEFLASCERFHAQIAGDAGVLTGCLTLAQLIAENATLTAERDRLREALGRVTWTNTCVPWCPCCQQTQERGHAADCPVAALAPQPTPAESEAGNG